MIGIMLIAVATGGACGALVRYGVMLVMAALAYIALSLLAFAAAHMLANIGLDRGAS